MWKGVIRMGGWDGYAGGKGGGFKYEMKFATTLLQREWFICGMWLLKITLNQVKDNRQGVGAVQVSG
jgi:hypothetical protein